MEVKVIKRLLWAILISIGFTVFLLSRIEWQQFFFIAGKLNIRYLIISCGVFMLGNLIRSFRFNQLDHTDKKLPHWWNINAFYNLITATLPGGAGEAATAYVLKRFSKLNILGAFRILLISRLMDLLALSALFFISAILISSDTPYHTASVWISVVLFFISSFALLSSSEKFLMRMMQKLPGQSILKQKIYEKLSELLKISEEQRRNKAFGMTLFQSLLMMTAGVVSVYLLLQSVGIDFTLVQSTYCYGVYMIFQIVPVQGIAGIGTQAAWWALALNAAGYRAPDAIAMGFVLHVAFYVFIAIIGIISLLLLVTNKIRIKWSKSA